MKQLNEVARMQQLAGIKEINILNPGRPKLSKINPTDVEDSECEIEIDGKIIDVALDENDDGEYTLSMQDSEYPKGVSIYNNFELIRKKIKNKYIFFDDNEWMHVSLEAFNIVDNINEIKINDPLSQNNFWKSLGDGFTIEDGYYHTPYGFIFDYDKDEEEFSSYIEYDDFGDDRDSGEEVIDPLLEEFENLLMKKHEELGIGYNIMTTSRHYYMTIQI